MVGHFTIIRKGQGGIRQYFLIQGGYQMETLPKILAEKLMYIPAQSDPPFRGIVTPVPEY